MATGTLTGQTIANTYKSLLKITGTTAGGETLHATTQKVIEDGDGNPFPLSAAADALMITSTNRLEFGDNASYIHQSADGVLDLVSDTEIELNATTIDINGAVDMSSTLTLGGRLTLSNDGSDNGLFLGGGWQIFDNASEAFGTAGDLVFYHGASRVVMTDTGEMGIGTPSPTGKVQIQTTTSGSADETLTLDTSQTSVGSGSIIRFTGNNRGFVGADIKGVIQASSTEKVSLIFDINDGTGTGEAFRLDHTRNVGINKNGPLTKLHIVGSTGNAATSGTTPTAIARFDSTYNSVLDIGQGADPYPMWIQAADRSNLAQFYNLSLQPVGGQVGIGTTAPATGAKLHTKGNGGGQAIAVFEDDTVNANVLIKASDANRNSILNFGDSASNEIGQIDYDHNDNSMGFVVNSSERMVIANNGDVTVNALLIAGSGVAIGGTGSANTLDDYEEGTWTPSLSYQNQTGVSLSYNFQVGIYTKIGNVVHVRFSISVDITGSPVNDNILIAGLPFTSQNVTNSEGSTIADQLQITGKSGYRLGVATNNTVASIVLSNITGNQGDDIGVGSNMRFHGGVSYFVPV